MGVFGVLRRSLAVAAALVCTMGQSPAPPATAGAPTMDDALAAIAAWAPTAMAEQGTPGLSVAITDRGKTLRIVTLGYANVDAKTPVTPQTSFAIGSITKSMTALALLRARDEGSVDLGAPVTRYLPWFRIESGGKPVLVHQLLSHTGGIPDDYTSVSGYGYDVVALRAAKTLFVPGTSWSYANDGYATAGLVLQQVDGRPWAASLQSRVLDALGMTATSPFFTPDVQARGALGYQFRDNDRPAPLHPALVDSPLLDFVDPAGSVLSTPEDMARYMRFYLNDGRAQDGTRLLSPQSFAALTHADRFANGKPAGAPGVVLAEAPAYYRQYGYGLSVFDDKGEHLIGHTGGISGYTACMQVNMTRGFGVTAFANLVEAPLHPCAIVLYAMAVLRAQSLGQPLPAPPAAPDLAKVSNPSQYAGIYTPVAGRASVQIIAGSDRIWLQDGGTKAAMYPRGEDQFWADDARYPLYVFAFRRDRFKHVIGMNYGPQWFTNPRYTGPRTFHHPKAWDGLAGRYENVFQGSPAITRVVIVNDKLTLDGTDALRPLPDGTFSLGDSVIRFDGFAGAQAQRMWIDGTDVYRSGLP